MKRWLVVLIFACAVKVHADQGVSPMFTYQTGVTSATVNIITVATSTVGGGLFVAANVSSPTLQGRAVIEIQNIDASANLWCLISSTAPATNAGRKIAAGNSWIVSILNSVFQDTYSSTTGNSTVVTPVNFYCVSDGASPTKAAVTQLY